MILLIKFKCKQNYADGAMFKNVVPGTVWEHERGGSSLGSGQQTF